MSATPPNSSQPLDGLPNYSNPREGRSVSFYVAIFLGLLLLVSGALNLLLLVVSAFGSAPAGVGGQVVEDDGVLYQLVAVAGDPDADASVLRVPISGAIAEAEAPLMGGAGGTVSQVARALRVAATEPGISAVLFDINSPGGGVTDSDEIWRMIRDFKESNEDVAVVAHMGDMAASGGYYIAAACDYIMARPTTITGSIGVIISTYNYGDALKELGIEAVSIISPDTPYKDILSPTRPMLPEERAKIEAIVQEMYDRFVMVVNEGRPSLNREEVKALATGEIYSAGQALEFGLVDAIKSSGEAFDHIAEMVDAESVRVLEHRRVPTFFDTLFQARGPEMTVERAVGHLLQSTTGSKFLYYWPGGR